MQNTTRRGGFATHVGFVLAAVGSAIGLGNIWKFPYITGVHGGGAFVLVYLACILLVGLPLMVAELSLGQRGGKNLQGALGALAQGPVGRRLGKGAGLLAMATSFCILAYYGVIAGYTFHFMGTSAGLFSLREGGAAASEYEALAAHAPLSSLWFTLFIALVVAVVSRGVHGGIERVCRWMMPALFGLLFALLVYVTWNGYAADALRFLFEPKWDALTPEAILEALGHAFFSLSLGMGTMVVYGSYLESEKNILRDSVTIVFLDTLIALLAGVVIFSAVFAGGAAPGSGPGLLFETLPPLFAAMPAGTLVASAFFALVFFAAWSSGISMLEVVVAWLVDEVGLERRRAALYAGGAVWITGLACAFQHSFFTFLENATGRAMLPLGGLLVAICAGWCIAREDREAGFASVRSRDLRCGLAGAWSLTLRSVTPALVVLVLLWQTGLV